MRHQSDFFRQLPKVFKLCIQGFYFSPARRSKGQNIPRKELFNDEDCIKCATRRLKIRNCTIMKKMMMNLMALLMMSALYSNVYAQDNER